jgi:SAM-dependent methyltransferase
MLIGACGALWYTNTGEFIAIEINQKLAERLKTEFPLTDVRCADFLEYTVDDLGTFDRIIMNPPFHNGADIKHIQHAIKFLKPGGRLVALCANGNRQRHVFKDNGLVTWEDLPAGSFSEQGTNVNVALLVIDAPEAPKPEPEPAPARVDPVEEGPEPAREPWTCACGVKNSPKSGPLYFSCWKCGQPRDMQPAPVVMQTSLF